MTNLGQRNVLFHKQLVVLEHFWKKNPSTDLNLWRVCFSTLSNNDMFFHDLNSKEQWFSINSVFCRNSRATRQVSIKESKSLSKRSQNRIVFCKKVTSGNSEFMNFVGVWRILTVTQKTSAFAKTNCWPDLTMLLPELHPIFTQYPSNYSHQSSNKKRKVANLLAQWSEF